MPPTYHDVYDRWRSAPEVFWAEAAEAVHWYRRWDAVLDSSRAPFHRWVSRRRVQQLLQRPRPPRRGRAGRPGRPDLRQRLPRTRSGKIVRGTVKRIADGVPWTVPETIDDPASLEEISAGLSAIGYPRA